MLVEVLTLLAAGATGALIKEILEDNKIKLPSIAQGNLDLGFLGSTIIGAFVGYVIDGSFLTAAMAGFTGFSVIQNLVGKKEKQGNDIETIIRTIAKDECVDPDLAVRVAKCESGLNPQATNTNADGSIDRGLYQINNKYHPEISDADAYDAEKSCRFFCKAFKAGHLSWWNASKTCWDLTG